MPIWACPCPGHCCVTWVGVARLKRVVPGIGGIKLPVDEAGTLIRLVRLRPGLTIPLHDHGGPELTMVFSGGLVEPERTLHRGDFSLRARPGRSTCSG